jgi:hypothetical protein
LGKRKKFVKTEKFKKLETNDKFLLKKKKKNLNFENTKNGTPNQFSNF